MSGKQKECGYSWTSEGEIHTCSLPEGHMAAHICGFVFNPSDCCLERAEPTPHEGEAVPEQRDKCIRCGAEECGHGKCPNCDFKCRKCRKLATPKPIGDVEAVARGVCQEVYGPYLATVDAEHRQRAIDKIAAILSPFFAPEPPCSECATLQDKLEIAQRYGQREYAIEQILRGDLSTAVAECATLRKERDDYEKAIAKALRFTPSEEEPEECAPWMVEAEPEPMGPFSLIEAITAMMEMFDREFSKADKRAEAAEAQLSTHTKTLLHIQKIVKGDWANYLDQIDEVRCTVSAALAPTPEVAKE